MAPTTTLTVVLLLLALTNTAFDDAAGEPISAPDPSACHLPYYIPEGEVTLNCCAPVPKSPPVKFQLPSEPPAVIKVRRPAHKQTPEYAAKLNRAYELMKALPPEDPRSFAHQANIHCAYCNGVYYQQNVAGNVSLEIHASWLFFSFHRWYLYFHERILAKLLGDDTLALSYWNYDNPDGASMPSIFVDYPELNSTYREPTHTKPPSVAIFDYPYVLTNYTDIDPTEQLAINNKIMYYVMVSGAVTPRAFFGEPLRAGDPLSPGHGTVEGSPHNTIHGYVGDYHSFGWKDMGALYASARDPVFYAHHAAIDRFWDVWKSLDPSRNVDLDDPDYLDSELSFYDENAQLVHVKVRDSFNSTLLGFTYEESELTWLDDKPSPAGSGIATASDVSVFCDLGGALLSEPCSVVVHRPEISNSIKPTTESSVEVLAIHGIKAEMSGDGGQARFDVFINLPWANESTRLDCTEYAGSFSMLPQLRHLESQRRRWRGMADNGGGSYMRSQLRLASVGFIVGELDLKEQRSLVVTLVPKPGAAIYVGSVGIEYEDSPSQSSTSSY